MTKTTVEPTPISAAKKKAAEPTTTEPVKKPKLTYAQRLAQLPPEEAAAIRAKANAASKASKARAKGFASPAVAKVMTLKNRLAANLEKVALLDADRTAIEQELLAIETQLIAEAATVEPEDGDATV